MSNTNTSANPQQLDTSTLDVTVRTPDGRRLPANIRWETPEPLLETVIRSHEGRELARIVAPEADSTDPDALSGVLKQIHHEWDDNEVSVQKLPVLRLHGAITINTKIDGDSAPSDAKPKATPSDSTHDALAGLLQKLTADTVKVTYEPGMFTDGDPDAMGHLFSARLSSTLSEDVRYMTLDDRRIDSLETQLAAELRRVSRLYSDLAAKVESNAVMGQSEGSETNTLWPKQKAYRCVVIDETGSSEPEVLYAGSQEMARACVESFNARASEGVHAECQKV